MQEQLGQIEGPKVRKNWTEQSRNDEGWYSAEIHNSIREQTTIPGAVAKEKSMSAKSWALDGTGVSGIVSDWTGNSHSAL